MPKAAEPSKPTKRQAPVKPAARKPRATPKGAETPKPRVRKPRPKPSKPLSQTRQAKHNRKRYAESKGQPSEWAGQPTGPQSVQAVSAAKRVNLLKQLIEPKTETLVEVLEEIALNRCVSQVNKDPKGHPMPIDVHPSIRMEAADRLLSRAYGKPKEHLVLDDEDGVGTDRDEVTTLLNNILKSVGAPTLDSLDGAGLGEGAHARQPEQEGGQS